MEITKKNLVLTFGTSTKSEESITISNPRPTLTGLEVKAAMDQALASGAIGEAVQATTIVGAKYIIQQVDTVDLAEA